MVWDAALDSNYSSGDMLGFVCIADDCREYLKGGNICINMIATVHCKLIVFGCHQIKGNDLFGVNGKGLELVCY